MFLTEKIIIETIVKKDFWDYFIPFMSAILSVGILAWTSYHTNKISKRNSEQNFEMSEQSNKIAKSSAEENLKMLERTNKITLFDKKYEVYSAFKYFTDKYNNILSLIEISTSVDELNDYLNRYTYLDPLEKNKLKIDSLKEYTQKRSTIKEMHFVFDIDENKAKEFYLFAFNMSMFAQYLDNCIYKNITGEDATETNLGLLNHFKINEEILNDPKLKNIEIRPDLFCYLIFIKTTYNNNKIDEMEEYLENKIRIN